MNDPAPFACHWCSAPFSSHRMSAGGDVLCPPPPAQAMADARRLYQPWAFELAPSPAAPAVGYEEPPRLLVAVGRLA